MPPPPVSEVQSKRSARWAWLFLLIAMVAILALIGRLARSHFRAEARMQAIRAAKLPTSGLEASTWIPAVPDRENGALVITQAFALMRNFTDARSNVVARTDLAANTWSPEKQASVREYLEMNRPALMKIAEGLRFEKFRFPVKYEDGLGALIPHISKFKQPTTMMGLNVGLAAVDGRTNEWAKNLRDEVRLAQTLEGEPMLISQLLRIAALNIARNAAEWALARGAPTSEDCKQLQELFWRADTNLFPNALICERAFALPVFRATINDIDHLGDEFDLKEGKLRSNGMTFYRAIGAADVDQVYYLDFMEKAISIARLGPPRNLQLVEEFENAAETAKARRYVVSGMVLPALAKAVQKFAGGEASMRITASAFAIERFRQVRGVWPENLQSLVPDFLASVPIDPFDGKELRYVRGTNGYRIYSVGDDKIDDGGRALKGRKKFTDKNTYDMVFEVNR